MIKNVIKGFIIGVGKIIPGVSGSMLAILMGVYEKALNIICNLKNMRTHDFLFIVTLAFGVFLSITLCSQGVSWCLENHYLLTMLLFIGLISSGVLEMVNKAFDFKMTKSVNIKPCIVVILAFGLSLVITIYGEMSLAIHETANLMDSIKFSLNTFILFFFIGLLEAFTSIIPGISGTAIFMSLGCYDLLLAIYANIFNLHLLILIIAFFAGIICGVLLLAHFITFMLSKHPKLTYQIILGFLLSSIMLMIMMLFKELNYKFDIFIVVKSLLVFCLGFYLGRKINLLLSKGSDIDI